MDKEINDNLFGFYLIDLVYKLDLDIRNSTEILFRIVGYFVRGIRDHINCLILIDVFINGAIKFVFNTN